MAEPEVYHEKQHLQLCAVHVLNHLFQSPSAFTRNELDSICLELNPARLLNPHRSWLGLGNYDINVIMSALSRRGLTLEWFDRRRPLDDLPVEDVFGYIVNIPSPGKIWGLFSLPGHPRHWVAIKYVKSRNEYFWLDSNEPAPKTMGQVVDVQRLLHQRMVGDPSVALLVVGQPPESGVDPVSLWTHGNENKPD